MFRRGGLGRGRRNNRGNGFLMLMLMQLGQRVHRLERKPPVTLALMGFMIFIYLQPDVAPSIGELCLSTANVDVFRLIGSAFLHASDMHLYYNMSSLLWKGVQIELSAGSQIFAVMLSILLVLSHGLYVIVGNLVGDNLPFGGAAGCAVGFSAVLFALKVVLNEGSGTHSSIWGISVPTKYAAWLELVVSSVISPRSSFLGHLCGIFAGYIWVRGGLGQKVGELVANPTGGIGTAEAWYNPVGMMRRNNPNQANGFFGGMGNMFSTLFGGDPGVPQQQQYQQQNQQQQYQPQQQPQQYQQQQHQQQQNSGNFSQQASSGFFEGLSGLFGGASTAATQQQQQQQQQQPQQQQQQQQGRTYGRGTTGNEDRHNNRSNDEEDERLRAAMEQSRAEYEQHQQRRQREINRDREPSEVPPPVPSSGPSSTEELRRRRMARFK